MPPSPELPQAYRVQGPEKSHGAPPAPNAAYVLITICTSQWHACGTHGNIQGTAPAEGALSARGIEHVLTGASPVGQSTSQASSSRFQARKTVEGRCTSVTI